MTTEKAKELVKKWKSCPCGGRLVLSGSHSKGAQLRHYTIKCKKCRAWYGGFTFKAKYPEGNK